jgi:hypothetical protein
MVAGALALHTNLFVSRAKPTMTIRPRTTGNHCTPMRAIRTNNAGTPRPAITAAVTVGRIFHVMTPTMAGGTRAQMMRLLGYADDQPEIDISHHGVQ